MRVLVTGANGFVGKHLVAELKNSGHEPITSDLATADITPQPDYLCNLSCPDAVSLMVKETTPDACIHLGGIAFVPVGWSNPQLMFNVNTIGTVNVLEAFRKFAVTARLLIISSTEVYGPSFQEGTTNEESALHPNNIYAVSKAAADLTGLLYHDKYSMHTMTARPSNHIGPGQNPDFVVPSFAAQLLKIKASGLLTGKIETGNLESERDFTDVRDIVKAYRLILEKGTPGQAYNIARGKLTKISFILSELCDITGVSPEIIFDPAKYRPAVPQVCLDTTRLRKDTGWTPALPMRQSLLDVVSDLRQKLYPK